MKRPILITILWFSLFYASSCVTAKDAQYSEIVVYGARYQIYKVPKNSYSINIYAYSKIKSKKIRHFKDLNGWIKKNNKELLFATNGGMFHRNYKPVGLLIQQNKLLSKLNLKNGTGNFFLKPNGVFFTTKGKTAHVVRSEDFHKYKRNVVSATQSGPMLVTKGQINKAFGLKSRNKHIRSGVGIDKKGNTFFAISTKKVNFYNLAKLFKEQLKCPNALYLDGVISSFLVNPKYKKIRRSPKYSKRKRLRQRYRFAPNLNNTKNYGVFITIEEKK